MSKFGVSQPVRRVEDLRFLTGAGPYVYDINLKGQVYAHVVRSSLAHGRILGLDTKSAKSLPGIIDIITTAELKARGANALGCEIPLNNRDGSRRANPARRSCIYARGFRPHPLESIADPRRGIA